MASFIKHLRFLGETPKATLRMMSGVFRTNVLRQNRLRNCQMALTFRCNHDCNMCSSTLLTQNKKELTLEQWFSYVDQAKELGCTHFDLTGGEPTMKGLDFLKKLVSYITRNNDCIVSLPTNGTIVDETWMKELKAAGLNSILFNIQSINPEIHDKIVGNEGNLSRIKSLIPVAKEVGLNICINTCMGNYNMDEIEELVEWCDNNNLFTLINLAAPTGKLVGQDVRIKELKNKYYEMLRLHPMMRSDTTYNYRGPNLCPGGIEKIYVTAYGEVMQCTFCQISFGNILNEPLKNIYKKFCEHPLIKKRDICKHSFNTEFREKWIDPVCDSEKVPYLLEDHPNYHIYCNNKK